MGNRNTHKQCAPETNESPQKLKSNSISLKEAKPAKPGPGVCTQTTKQSGNKQQAPKPHVIPKSCPMPPKFKEYSPKDQTKGNSPKVVQSKLIPKVDKTQANQPKDDEKKEVEKVPWMNGMGLIAEHELRYNYDTRGFDRDHYVGYCSGNLVKSPQSKQAQHVVTGAHCCARMADKYGNYGESFATKIGAYSEQKLINGIKNVFKVKMEYTSLAFCPGMNKGFGKKNKFFKEDAPEASCQRVSEIVYYKGWAEQEPGEQWFIRETSDKLDTFYVDTWKRGRFDLCILKLFQPMSPAFPGQSVGTFPQTLRDLFGKDSKEIVKAFKEIATKDKIVVEAGGYPQDRNFFKTEYQDEFTSENIQCHLARNDYSYISDDSTLILNILSNHGASGGPLIVGDNLVGILSRGNVEEKFTIFKIFDEVDVEFINAVMKGEEAMKKFDLAQKSGDASYRVQLWILNPANYKHKALEIKFNKDKAAHIGYMDYYDHSDSSSQISQYADYSNYNEYMSEDMGIGANDGSFDFTATIIIGDVISLYGLIMGFCCVCGFLFGFGWTKIPRSRK